MSELIVHSEIDREGALVATVVGDIDVDTAGRLVETLQQSRAAPDVLDLRFVSFLSASGLRSVVPFRSAAPARVVCSHAVRRMVELCGLSDDIALHDPTGPPHFDRFTHGVAVHAADGRYLYLNDTLAAINGRPAGDHLGRSPAELWDIEHDDVLPILQHVATRQEPYHVVVDGATERGLETSWDCWYRPARYTLDGHDEAVVLATVRPDPDVRHDRHATLRFSAGVTPAM